MVYLARDYPPALPAARVRDGTWIRVRPGAYVDAPVDLHQHARDHLVALARIVALREQLTRAYALSHGSAALLWGLPLLRSPAHTHVMGMGNPSTHVSDIRRHAHRLPASHVTAHLGHQVTTLERTVIDCAMALGPLGGLVVADAALHVGASRERCLEILDTMAGRRGVVTARAVLELADDGAESPGESSTRFVLLRAGLPTPETQVRVRTHLGTFWSDLGWPDWHLLAEYDGRVKYEANGPASEAVIEEKRRQDAIEERGYRVLRITKEDLRAPERLVRRVLSAAPPGATDRLGRRSLLMAPPPRSTT